MRRVTGIGGIFFKARDADALRAWYRRHLGLDIPDWGGIALPPPPVQPTKAAPRRSRRTRRGASSRPTATTSAASAAHPS